MIYSGLVSITFRKLSPAAIIDLVTRAGLDGIEWGGDVHVPHGDLVQARAVCRMTEAAGLRVAAYGSYYRVGHEEPVPFGTVLDTARALGAPVIRVWAGKQGSAEAGAAYRERVVEASRAIAAQAEAAGIAVAYEFHGGTLTDTNESAQDLLQAAGARNLRAYWQPPQGADVEYGLAGLDAVEPWLRDVHVFTWRKVAGEPPAIVRQPLGDGEAAWLRYLRRIVSIGGDHFAMIEFVRDDDPQVFLEDAATLKRWLALVATQEGSGGK